MSELRAYTVAATTTTYDYDADGFLTRAGSRLFQYDARGLLTHLVDVGQVDRSFVYGPGGQLLAEDDGAGGQRQHVTLGPELYASYDPNGVPTQKLLPGERLDFKAAVTPYAGGLPGETQYLFPDVQGTTHQVMTGADLMTLAPGRLLETRLHSAFGEPLALPVLRQAGPPPPVGLMVLANQAWLVLDLVSFGAEVGLPALARRAGLTGARLGSRVGHALPAPPPLTPAAGPMVDGVPVHANAVARGRFGELVVVHGPAGPGGALPPGFQPLKPGRPRARGPSIRALAKGQRAPDPIPWRDRTISLNLRQNELVQIYAEWADSLRARDIRINQTQVNVAGWKVSDLRPDLQFSIGEQRFYVELDTIHSRRGPVHRRALIGKFTTEDLLRYLGEFEIHSTRPEFYVDEPMLTAERSPPPGSARNSRSKTPGNSWASPPGRGGSETQGRP